MGGLRLGVRESSPRSCSGAFSLDCSSHGDREKGAESRSSKPRWQAIDEPRTTEVQPRIHVETLITSVDERLSHRLGRLPGHFRNGGMSVHELPATEVPQERLSAVGPSPGVDKRLMLVELVQ